MLDFQHVHMAAGLDRDSACAYALVQCTSTNELGVHQLSGLQPLTAANTWSVGPNMFTSHNSR